MAPVDLEDPLPGLESVTFPGDRGRSVGGGSTAAVAVNLQDGRYNKETIELAITRLVTW